MRSLQNNRPRHRAPSASAILFGAVCIYGSVLATPLIGQEPLSFSVDGPMVLLTKVPFNLTIRTDGGTEAFYSVSSASGKILVSGELPTRSEIVTPDIELASDDLPLLVKVQSDSE